MSKGQALAHEEQREASRIRGGTAQEQRQSQVDQNLAGMQTRHVASAAAATAAAIPEAHPIAFTINKVHISQLTKASLLYWYVAVEIRVVSGSCKCLHLRLGLASVEAGSRQSSLTQHCSQQKPDLSGCKNNMLNPSRQALTASQCFIGLMQRIFATRFCYCLCVF